MVPYFAANNITHEGNPPLYHRRCPFSFRHAQIELRDAVRLQFADQAIRSGFH